MAAQIILIVDDDALVRESIEMMLKGSDFALELAESGAEALERYQPGKFAVVLTDNRMAGMTGVQLGRAIRGRDPAQSIILFSGSPPLGPEPCFDKILVKPFSAVELRQAVTELAGRTSPPSPSTKPEAPSGT